MIDAASAPLPKASSGPPTGSAWPTVSSMPTGSGYPSGTGYPPVPLETGSPYPYPNATNSSSPPDFVRGVNIGGWLVLEKWMTPEVFEGTDAEDQWSFDSQVGAFAKIHQHWETYFTEADVQTIASWGINSLRLPIGFWAYDNAGTPYIKGADAYLEQAIGWAREAGLKVLIDLHGVPGGQNGFDNSGHSGVVDWQKGDNMERTISVLETITKKYGCESYSDVVIGIELVNEPISWEPNSFDVTQEWTSKAYRAVRAAATNRDLQIVMHDSFATPFAWTDLAAKINGNVSIDAAPFAIDTHLYQNQVEEDSQLNQEEHSEKACNWTNSALLPPSANLPVYVGEWSAQTNVCANPDGSTTAGTECETQGCQCSVSTDMADWDSPLVEATRRYVEAQLEAFERSSSGWYIWSYKGPGAWGMSNLMEYVYEKGEKITDRKFEGICNF